jgi:dTDP-4-dehydrorhamnose 3,5-epimerase
MKIRTEPTPIPGVTIVVPDSFDDARGFFYEVYRQDEATSHGLPDRIVQINQSKSARGVVRGLHFQWDPPVGKLMRVIHGTAFLVAVDLRKDSPTLGKWFGEVFTAAAKKQLWAPASFARGFCALTEGVEIEYLTTALYNPRTETGIRWNDPAIGIQWPIADPQLSDRDRKAQTLAEWLARPESERFKMEGGS